MRRGIFCIIFLVVIFGISSSSQARPPHPTGRGHADLNDDGIVDRKEVHIEQAWEAKQRAKVNNWWEKRADTNGDGIVDTNELAAWRKLEKERIDLNNDGVIDAKERRLCWRHARSRVNTELEKKYDANNNGWLEPEEVKELLKDRYALIQTQGKAKVDTEIEAEYDSNGDGIIDTQEAKDLKEDLGL
jgi:Ca2+-binding EF-hand superfamily protein